MDDLTDFMQRQRPPKPFTVKNINREVIKPHQQPTSNMLENLCAVNFSFDSCSSNQHPDFRKSYVQQQISGSYHPNISCTLPVSNDVALNHNAFPERENIKHMEPSSGRTSKCFSPAGSTCSIRKRNSLGTRKKGKEMDKMEEVVHVRAKRGQATDSHSIAERSRREKIKSKLKCLQEIVPGCHKSMGMANMLEEIINYVHSLQNQVELLSMELAAASSACDLTIDKFLSKKLEETNSPEAQEMQKWPREQYAELNSSHYSPWSI